MRFLFVTNFCPHYRVRTFEILARRADVRFVFFSAGDEWYWDQRHGRQTGDFPHEYLKGLSLTRWFRVTPRLLPIVWRYDGDVILKCITGRFALPVTLIIAKLRGKPFVLWTGMWRHPRTLFHVLTYPVARLVYHLSDAVVVYGEHVKRYLVSLGVDPRKIFIAPHAVDNQSYNRAVSVAEIQALRDRLGLGDRRVVLFVGRLEASKGLETLLEAFATLRRADTALVLVGEGTRAQHLRDRAEQLGIADRVVFTGYVPKLETVPFYALADVFVLPSVTVPAGRETWGLVINEAFNQGTPVVATTAVGAAMGGLVQPGRNGEVVAEREVAPLASALERILSDGTLRARLSRGAREVVAAWDDGRMADGFLAAVRYAAARRRSP